MKNISISIKFFALAATMVSIASCSGFLDVIPKDALTPETTWKNKEDAQKFLTGCYNNWLDGGTILYWDCTSDIGYNFHSHEGFQVQANGSMTASNPGSSYYSYGNIQRCNNFLDNIGKPTFANEGDRKEMTAQIRVMRAHDYFEMNFWYGGVPIVPFVSSADEAKIPRSSEEDVKKFVYDEIDAAIPDMADKPDVNGRMAKGAALAIKMRSALYWGDYQRAVDAANAIKALSQYDLHPDYAELFSVKGQGSKEIILARPYLAISGSSLYWTGPMYNNGEGGWSSMVPTQNLINTYEMNDGLTKDESSAYDPTHPFKGRDPRMAMTVLFPGADYVDQKGAKRVFNTLDQTVGGEPNPNYPTAADNSSKTALTWAKYTYPMDQYSNIFASNASPIAFRFAEVLLSYAEAKNELSGPSGDVYDALDRIRTRAGMPVVDRAKYGSKETLRELIRRERCVELAGEGLRRADIVRWKDASGKMVAETVLNGPLNRITGTINPAEPDPYKRATIDVSKLDLIENRECKPENRYLPIPKSSRDKNPKLTQNPGY